MLNLCILFSIFFNVLYVIAVQFKIYKSSNQLEIPLNMKQS